MRRVFLLAALVALAGCSGALGGDTPTPPVTPAPVPSATPTATPGISVPGVTDGWLTDPGTLVTAHRIAISEVGYTRVRVERAERDGRTRWTLTTRTRVAPDGRRHAVIVPKGPEEPPTVLPNTTRVERYIGESATWVAVWRNGERRVTQYPQGFAVGRPTLYPVLGSVPLRVTGQNATADGVRYRLAGSGVRDEELFRAAARRGDAVGPRLVATVTGRGVVRSYAFSYAVAAPPATDAQRTFTHRFHLKAVGKTTVPVPGWVPTGNASTAG